MAVRSGDIPSYRGHRTRQALIPHYQSPSSGGVEKTRGHGMRKKLPHLCWKMRRTIFQSTKRMLLLWVPVIICLSFWLGRRNSKDFHSAVPPRPRVLILESPYQTRYSFTNGGNWEPTIQLPDAEKPKFSDKSDDKYRMPFDDEETGCSFIAEWQSQTSAKPTCNQLHEVGIRFGDSGLMHRLEPIDSGGFKDVWRVMNEDNTPTDFVLKTTLYERNFGEKDLNKHRRDALVMDEATSTPYVLNMYGYCGHSGLVEAATGTLQHWLKDFRKKVAPLQLLRVAVLVAHGVADMHLYHNGMPTLAHADIKVSQFLMINSGRLPTFKINDFNRGRFLTSRNPPQICPFVIKGKHKGSTSRAPEEYIKEGALTDKIDVFSLGSVLYYILTGEAPFEEEEDYADAIKKITSGVEAPLSKAIENSKDPSIITIVDAMKKCRQFRAEDRPNSREVANLLTEALGRISGHKE